MCESSDDNLIINKYEKKRYEEIKSLFIENIIEIKTEKELINKTEEEKMIVHFYNEGFKYCKEMDFALQNIIKDYSNIKFYRINAETCPLVSYKLKISVLPFLGFFSDGYFVGQLIGFEGIGDTYCDIKKLKEIINQSKLLLK